MTIIVTGVAGFVGFHLATALLSRGDAVVGIDNLNAYYDPELKAARLERLARSRGFTFHRLDIADRDAIHGLCGQHRDVEVVVHLAAQAGVRYSLLDPYAYVHANVMGHLVLLEGARLLPRLRHFVYASSSSVYGANRQLPFAEADRVDTPLSIYAVTKRSDELMSYAYAHLFGLPQTGLRFFTVYGPWGRPDMAYYSFARAIMEGKPITVYDGGRLKRDFTYIDDVVAGIQGVLDRVPDGAPPVRLLNLGNHRSETVGTLVALLEQGLGRKAIIREEARPPADVEETFADIRSASEFAGFSPATPLSVGIPRFVSWFREFHRADMGG